MHAPTPHNASTPASGTGPSQPCTGPPGPEVLDSTTLLNGQREIRIRHGNDTYRLRHTRNDKLILTK